MTTQTSPRPVVEGTPRPPTAADIVRIYRERGFTPLRQEVGWGGSHCALGALYRSVGWDGSSWPDHGFATEKGQLAQRYGVGGEWLNGLSSGFDSASAAIALRRSTVYHAGYAVGREAARLLFDEPPL